MESAAVTPLPFELRLTSGLISATAKPTLHLYSPLSDTPYRTIKMRKKVVGCRACGEIDQVFPDKRTTKSTPRSRWDDAIRGVQEGRSWPGEVEKSCAVNGDASSIPNRVSVKSLSDLVSTVRTSRSTSSALAGQGRNVDREEGVVIIDVRSETEFGLCSLPSSISASSRILFSCSSDDIALTRHSSREIAARSEIRSLLDPLLASRLILPRIDALSTRLSDTRADEERLLRLQARKRFVDRGSKLSSSSLDYAGRWESSRSCRCV